MYPQMSGAMLHMHTCRQRPLPLIILYSRLYGKNQTAGGKTHRIVILNTLVNVVSVLLTLALTTARSRS